MTHQDQNIFRRAQWFGGTVISTIAVFLDAFSLSPSDAHSFDITLTPRN